MEANEGNLPFGDLIPRDLSLHSALVSAFFETPQCSVLGLSSRDTLSPHAEARSLHFSAHQLDDLLLTQSELEFDRFKRRPVFPSHFDDPVDVRFF